jgi:hypothetical protein
MTNLWPFLNLEKFYIIQGLVLLSGTEKSQAHCPTDNSYILKNLFYIYDLLLSF